MALHCNFKYKYSYTKLFSLLWLREPEKAILAFSKMVLPCRSVNYNKNFLNYVCATAISTRNKKYMVPKILWDQFHLILHGRYVLAFHRTVQRRQNTGIILFSIWRAVMKFARGKGVILTPKYAKCAKKCNCDRHIRQIHAPPLR